MAGNPNKNQTNSPTQIGISRLVEYFGIKVPIPSTEYVSCELFFWAARLAPLPLPSDGQDDGGRWAQIWTTQITQVLGFMKKLKLILEGCVNHSSSYFR